jgi:ribosome-associated protein
LPKPGAGAKRRAILEDDVLSHSDPATGLPVGTRAVRMTAQAATARAELSSDALLAVILASLDGDKAEEVVTIDLRGRSDMADYMVICSGRSSRQVAAISEKLVDQLKQDHRRASKIEGKETGDWVLIDTGDVIVHVFRPEVRDFYQLEKMWMPTGSRSPAEI